MKNLLKKIFLVFKRYQSHTHIISAHNVYQHWSYTCIYTVTVIYNISIILCYLLEIVVSWFSWFKRLNGYPWFVLITKPTAKRLPRWVRSQSCVQTVARIVVNICITTGHTLSYHTRITGFRISDKNSYCCGNQFKDKFWHSLSAEHRYQSPSTKLLALGFKHSFCWFR